MDETKYDLFFVHEERTWWFTARRDILLRLLEKFGPPPPARLLDVGCGTGMLAIYFARMGYRVMGLDASPKALDYVRRRDPAIETVEGEFPDRIQGDLGAFQVVGLLDVLEHMDDDARGLSVARDLLMPGGTLLVTVPALPSMWSAHDDVNLHRRRYVLRELGAKVRAAGFEVLFLSYFNCFLLPLAWIMRKIRRNATGLEDHEPPPFPLNPLLRWIFLLERPLLDAGRRLPIGLSLVCVARRPKSIVSAREVGRSP